MAALVVWVAAVHLLDEDLLQVPDLVPVRDRDILTTAASELLAVLMQHHL